MKEYNNAKVFVKRSSRDQRETTDHGIGLDFISQA